MSGRVPGLDGVRGVAILLVLLSHVAGLLGAGIVGVLTFFVLSGYLITGLLLDESASFATMALGRFYARRAVRLLPALVGLLTVIYAVSLVPGAPVSRSDAARGAWQALTYTTNLAVGFGLDLNPHTEHLWTLSVEEQFYIAWPIVLLIVLRRVRPGSRVRVVSWFVGVAALARVVTVLVSMTTGWYFYVLPTTWGDTILIGCLLAVFVREAPDRLGRLRRAALHPVVLCSGSALVVLAAVWPSTYWAPVTYVVGLPVLALWAVQLVLASTAAEAPNWSRVLVSRPMRWLGTRSYALYLYNSAAILVGSALIGPTAGRVVGVGAALVLAEVSWRTLERPALALHAHLGHLAPIRRGVHGAAVMRAG